MFVPPLHGWAVAKAMCAALVLLIAPWLPFDPAVLSVLFVQLFAPLIVPPALLEVQKNGVGTGTATPAAWSDRGGPAKNVGQSAATTMAVDDVSARPVGMLWLAAALARSSPAV